MRPNPDDKDGKTKTDEETSSVSIKDTCTPLYLPPSSFFLVSPFLLQQLAIRLQVLCCCLLRICACNLSDGGTNVYVVQCIVSSLHSVLVRIETALKHYLNHWTLQYSSKIKRDIFLICVCTERRCLISILWSEKLVIK